MATVSDATGLPIRVSGITSEEIGDKHDRIFKHGKYANGEDQSQMAEMELMKLEDLQINTVKWFKDRNIIEQSNLQKQFIKLNEEVNEIGDGIAAANKSEIIDGIGDVIVVLTGMAEMIEKSINQCWDHAYNEIKDRKGMMIKGVYVKYDDLSTEQKQELDKKLSE